MSIYFMSLFLYAKASKIEVRVDSNGFFMGWWGSRAKATFSKVGDSLFQ